MKVHYSVEGAKKQVKHDKNQGNSIGLIPTMGALHDGHLALIRASIEQSDRTYVSIFVNPAQFNEQKDLDSYPIELESDLEKLNTAGVDIVFVPKAEDMYPPDLHFPVIDLAGMDTTLEGSMRPGHFQGVAKVIYRLFDILHPDYAYFGQKDFQQTVVVKHVVEQFDLGVDIVVCPTIREANGLAMSSRNVRLNASDRAKAGFLYRTLVRLKEDINYMTLGEAIQKATNYLDSLPGVEIEYFEAVNGKTMEVVHDLHEEYVVCVTVVRFGGIRMLDNMVLKESYPK